MWKQISTKKKIARYKVQRRLEDSTEYFQKF